MNITVPCLFLSFLQNSTSNNTVLSAVSRDWIFNNSSLKTLTFCCTEYLNQKVYTKVHLLIRPPRPIISTCFSISDCIISPTSLTKSLLSTSALFACFPKELTRRILQAGNCQEASDPSRLPRCVV